MKENRGRMINEGDKESKWIEDSQRSKVGTWCMIAEGRRLAAGDASDRRGPCQGHVMALITTMAMVMVRSRRTTW